MNRRKETRIVTKTVETRVEFSVEELRKRLRLPEDAVLIVESPAGDPIQSISDGILSATFTRTAQPKTRTAAGPDDTDVRGTVSAPHQHRRARVFIENPDGTKTEVKS